MALVSPPLAGHTGDDHLRPTPSALGRSGLDPLCDPLRQLDTPGELAHRLRMHPDQKNAPLGQLLEMLCTQSHQSLHPLAQLFYQLQFGFDIISGHLRLLLILFLRIN